jgi:hypothetical protein
MKRIKICAILLILLFISGQFSAFGQPPTRGAGVKTNKSSAVKRVALVIGNGNYTKAATLKNPTNDAADMSRTLKDLGFEVFSGTDLNKREMENLIRQFGNRLLESKGVGLFYYAGHGVQVKGENYLIPVDADIPQEDEIAYEAVPVGRVLVKMNSAENDLNLVILDACRNNPFARSWRGTRAIGKEDGLAKISPPTGTLVLYATEPGKVASDGEGRNGLFTEALLKQIKRPNIEYDQMVRAVSADVWEQSNKQQLPWKEGNSLKTFYFKKTKDGNTETPNANLAETAFWRTIENSNDKQDFENYLSRSETGEFSGTYRAVAELKLNQIRKADARTSFSRLRELAGKLTKFSYVHDFSDGLARVLVVSGYKEDAKEGKTTLYKAGYIDETGKLVIPAIYESASDFSYGLAAVGSGDSFTGKWGFIDKTGKIAIPLKYNYVQSFSFGLAAVKVGKKYGYINPEGREVIPFQFDYAGTFSDGFAKVRIGGKTGFINTGGKIVLEPSQIEVGDLSERMAVVGTNSSKYGYIDGSGKLIVPMKYDRASSFSEGRASVQIGTDYKAWKAGFIDRTGKEVIPLKYSSVFPFSEGLASVRIGDYLTGKYGFIDKNGEIVIPARFENPAQFRDGLAVFSIRKTGKFGYIDKTGKIIIPAKYDGVWTRVFIREGILGLKKNGKRGFVDIYGNEYFDF